ncbi:MAG: hypothetical protein RIR02_1157 [Pseudomonadota bacterium]|jgi:twitching motility protein PilI
MQDSSTTHAHVNRAQTKIARRHQLREFQREITEKTFNSQEKNTTSDSRRLAVQVGAENYLMHLGQTGEVLAYPFVTRIPNTKTWFLGLFSHRDRLLGLTDLAGMVGKEIFEKNKTDKILTCAATVSLHCAFRVTRILGLIDIKQMKVKTTEEKTWPWLMRNYIDANENMWTEIDLQKIINHPSFLDISLRSKI